MRQPEQILHVVADLDGYGLTRQLELLVTAQLAAGQQVRVLALAATSKQAVTMLQRMDVDCCVLDRRWRRDPFAALRLITELRRHPIESLHLWGQSAVDYHTALRRFVPPTPTLVTRPQDPPPSVFPTPEPPTPLRQQGLADCHLSDDALAIVVAGPLTRDQRIDEAIWNFELVRTLEPRAALLIFGDGPDRHRCERFARLASEPSALRFLGYRPDFRALLPHADLFWHTAAPSQAYPLTVLEALAAGVPVLATEGLATTKILNDSPNSPNAHLIPNGDRAIFARHTLRLLSTQSAKENHPTQ